MAVGAIELSQSSVVIGPAESATLSAVVRGVNGEVLTDRQVTWTSGHDLVATVTGGQVLGVAFGATTVTATVEGKSAQAAVSVTATQPSHVAGSWRMQSFDDKTLPATYWSEEDSPLPDGTLVDVEIRLDSAKMTMRSDGVYPFRQYCFSELHDTVVRLRYCWGDHGGFVLTSPGILSLWSEYIQNLAASGTVTNTGALALTEPLWISEPRRATIWNRVN